MTHEREEEDARKPPDDEPSSFARFSDFLRRLVAVPKEEADKREQNYKKRRARAKRA